MRGEGREETEGIFQGPASLHPPEQVGVVSADQRRGQDGSGQASASVGWLNPPRPSEVRASPSALLFIASMEEAVQGAGLLKAS